MTYGLAGLDQMLKEVASRRNFAPRKRINDFRWDGDKSTAENSIALRFLGDDIIIGTAMHKFITLPNGKAQSFVCRRANPILDSYCYICDDVAARVAEAARNDDPKERAKKLSKYKPSPHAVGLAVEQKSVWEGKIFKGYEDKLIEFEIPPITDFENGGEVSEDWKAYRKLLNNLGKPGTKVMIPNVGIVQNSLSTFWSFAATKQTICDRVYEISRQGARLDTKYFWNHEGPDREPRPIEEIYAQYSIYPFETPTEWVLRMSDPGRYEYFFNQKPEGDSAPSPSRDSGVVGSRVREAEAEEEDVEPVAKSREDWIARLKGGRQ